MTVTHTPQAPAPEHPDGTPDPNWLGEFAANILSKAVAILGPDAPSRRYVSHGTPVPDCDQLTVHLSELRAAGVQVELTRPQLLPRGSLEVPPAAVFVVTLYKCIAGIPVGVGPMAAAPPTADTLNTDGLMMLRLLQNLWYGLVQAGIDGLLFPSVNRPAILWRPASPLTPAGGFAGWTFTVEVSLT